MKQTTNEAKFELGMVVMTGGAVEAFEISKQTPDEILSRHSHGDWGTICEEDKRRNDEALESGLRILSSYDLDSVNTYDLEPEKIWVITEADRSATTILLPGEY